MKRFAYANLVRSFDNLDGGGRYYYRLGHLQIIVVILKILWLSNPQRHQIR